MTPKQILDSFSETLIRDERILSTQERALIAALLQHAKSASGANPDTQEAVRSVIASAIGETVAQRAFAVLGSSIVQRILQNDLPEESATFGRTVTTAGPPPPPSPSPGPQTPGTPPPLRETPLVPSPPSPGPQTPGHGVTKPVVSGLKTSVAEMPDTLPAQCVVLDEFLAPQELAELTRFTMEHQADFEASEVLSPHAEKGVVNYHHRRSRVLTELGSQQDVIVERIKSVLPQVLRKLSMEKFAIRSVEAQITASNDGDFFHFHSDNGADHVASRHLTFVYFFHREPRPFEGGELRIHDARLEAGAYVSQGTYQTIVPQQNQIVFFPCELMHEITPVKCESGRFEDSRFTLNGWLRQ
jgi:Rps23 Pro-64 3,4-dihydroxylase Tpa1-like proline 4-hydroxylase